MAVNPYDRCISNSTIKVRQCTITWYVDNTKVSQIDEELNTKAIETTAKNIGNLVVPRGKKHEFLGMHIKFLAEGKLSLFMKYYI